MARRIIRRSTISGNDLVLEIGPGKGVLTRELARVAGRVVAVEKDPKLAALAQARMSRYRNVEILSGDFFERPLPDEPYKVFASVPFNATADIVRRFTESENPPQDAYLVVQREAAERFLGEPKTTLAALLLHPWFTLTVIHRFRRRDFTPRPSVDTVLLRIERRERPLVRRQQAKLFRDFVAYGFSAWQPDVRSAYRRVLGPNDVATIEHSGPDLSLRPSQLPVADWWRLFEYFRCNVPKRNRVVISGAHRRLQRQQEKLTKSHRTRSPGWRKRRF